MAEAYPRLVFLGTGGGAHAGRCHAAIAVQLAPQQSLLLDTAGGFEVVRNLARTGIDLRSVTRIFLSHRHSDHLGGLEPLLLHIGLQALWGGHSGDSGADLYLYGHPQVLQAAQTIIEAMASAAPQFLDQVGTRLHWSPLTPDTPVDIWPHVRLTPFAADHVPEDGTALGCVVEWEHREHRRRIVYTGDTRPLPALPRLA
ncbi:MAG: MBL fold metallo-hydrolase, partial [Chloroflexota bacterium]